jgi:NAD(P)H-flavin reductase
MHSASGYFLFHASQRPAVFVATGTGIAPFVAYARAGIKGALLLHGVRRHQDLYYRRELEGCVKRYVACLTQALPSKPQTDNEFRGQVDDYIRNHLRPGAYDFYVCGHRQMIQTVTHLVDQRFQKSRIYGERFY